MKLPFSSPAQIDIGGTDHIVTVSIGCGSPAEAAALRRALENELVGVCGGLTFHLRRPLPRTADELWAARRARRAS